MAIFDSVMDKQEQPSIFLSDFSDTCINSVEFAAGRRPELFYSSQGGYSLLYRFDREGRFRVLKALKAQYRGNPLYERLLRKEFEIGYELDHPNICKVYSFCKVEGLGNCIEMEYVDGCTLDDFLSDAQFDHKAVRRVLSSLCDALAYIHNKQVIHRDLKPQNILVTYNGRNVKLIDFGLSDSDWHSVLKGMAGTREYAAPELLENGEIDNRTDIYSLGRLLELCGPAYKSVASKCTQQQPGKRFASAEEVKAALLRGGNRRFTIAPIVLSAIILLALLAWHLLFYDDISDTVDKIFCGVGQKIIDAQR